MKVRKNLSCSFGRHGERRKSSATVPSGCYHSLDRISTEVESLPLDLPSKPRDRLVKEEDAHFGPSSEWKLDASLSPSFLSLVRHKIRKAAAQGMGAPDSGLPPAPAAASEA